MDGTNYYVTRPEEKDEVKYGKIADNLNTLGDTEKYEAYTKHVPHFGLN